MKPPLTRYSFYLLSMLLSLSMLSFEVHATGVKVAVKIIEPFGDGVKKSTAKRASLEKAEIALVNKALKKSRGASAKHLLDNCTLDPQTREHSIKQPKQEVSTVEKQIVVTLRGTVDLSVIDNHLKSCIKPSYDTIGFVVVARRENGKAYLNGIGYEKFNTSIESGLTEEFNQRGFNVASELEMELRSDGLYRKGRLVSSYEKHGAVNWQSAADAGFISGMQYLTMGTVDIGLPNKNPANGKTRIQVVANFNSADLTSRKIVASVHKLTEDAEGDTPDEAINNALKRVAKTAGQKLADQIQRFLSVNH